MEGGMTRRRGYVWLTILFLVATGVLLASQPKGTSTILPPLPDSLVPTTDSLSPSSQPNPLAPTASVWHAIPKKKPLDFELNSADSLDLVQLYNIGPTIARRILKYRSLLGGYYCKEQLHEVYGIDSTRYADIAPHLTVNSALVTRLDLNTATIDQLKRHPYLDYYQAKAIVRMREEKGAFNQVSDILNIPIIDTETFKHIEPYLTCNSQPNK